MNRGTVLLDTNIVIDVIGGLDIAHTKLSRQSSFAISRITWIEVMTGLRPEEEPMLRDMLATLLVLDVSTEIALRTVQLRRTTHLKLADALIYATALEHGMTLFTRNTRDFKSDWLGIYVPYMIEH